MPGIIFFKTGDLQKIVRFYTSQIGMSIWLEQPNCSILQHGNLLLGFCERDGVEQSAVITFFVPTTKDVDNLFSTLQENATTKPTDNLTYSIYHFFATDPEGRTIEIQCFRHQLSPYLTATEALLSRRSVRQFTDQPVPEEILWQIFENCRFAPTSKNSQSYHYIVIRNREKIEKLARIREGASAPLASAPLAVSIYADSGKTLRTEQDGCIAAYHFILACWTHGLGTCWIADMDRSEVKQILGIDERQYVATVTPVGFPARIPKPPQRRPREQMVRFLD